MIPELRQQFNARFTPETYQTFLSRIAREAGTPFPFRVCETPCFFESSVLEKMARYGKELIRQLMGNPTYLAAASETVPTTYRVPNEAERPLFVQVDFGLDEQLEPKLVEIQGFPSVYAVQSVVAEMYREVYELGTDLNLFLSGLTFERYHEILRRAIVGDHDPENVVLLEIQPFQQKTLPDFLLTERFYEVTPVCITEVEQEGNRLFYRRENRRVPIERIYNRVIVEELVRKNITPAFDLRDDLNVEWAGHPNWYFKISKFSLPFFDHPCVPETHFLDRLDPLPDDLENWVLKPLFSFAGQGVIVGPTSDEIATVTDRSQYVLQRRIHFVPTIETPHGPTKCEIRIMFVWQEDLLPVIALTRMGRGKMMGVDFNRNLEWVGASAVLTPG